MHLRVFFLLLLVSLGNVLAVQFPHSKWNLATYHGAYAIFGEGFVSVTDGGSDYWHVQLTRSGIELRAGKTYEVRFFLQGVSARRYVEVRIGRDGFPYDAFAEFGEVVATANGRTVTRTFTMQSGSVSNARFEFNLGKATGTVYVADISLDCLDCGDDVGAGDLPVFPGENLDYAVVADTVDFRDGSMSLGSVFGTRLELGADSKVFGDVDVAAACFLRERTKIDGGLRYGRPCAEQNGVSAKTKSAAKLSKPAFGVPNIVPGISPVSVGLEQSAELPPGSYGTFYAAAKSRIRFSSGAYAFQYFYTEPDAEIIFDLSAGPVTVGVSGSVRFGDRNRFSVIGGNPSEILWNVSGERVDMGTDGLYFGKFVAPDACVRIPSRSHLVGGVYARKFAIEPQSTVSREPRARESSHSEEHFGPFFEPGRFRYRSQVSPSLSRIEMFVYADSLQVTVNGGPSRVVELSSSEVPVDVSLRRNPVAGFPSEAFHSHYRFDFLKNANYRIYWNPQTPCRLGCDGMTAATAIGDFEKALETARTTGREINMAGGTWNASENFPDSTVPWKVGFELVGNTENLGNLSSEDDLPLIDLGNAAHIEIEGRSPRSLTGFRIANGYNAGDGGAIYSNSQKLGLKNLLVSSSKSGGAGGAVFASDTINLENVRILKSSSFGNGGAVSVGGFAKFLNVLFTENTSAKNGGALGLNGANAYIGNGIFYGNRSGLSGGAVYNENSLLNIWNSTFFANLATTANGALGGNAKGMIGNSIFWKNITSKCSSEDCSSEVVVGYSATNSSFTNAYVGNNIYVGDPKFADEKNPEGRNAYMDYDAGINLSEDSPLLKAGIADINVPTDDLLSEIRNMANIALGAYAYAKPKRETSFGVLDKDGSVVSIKPSIPLINAISGDYYREYLATSPYARVWKATVKKHKKTKKDKAHVKMWVVNRRGEKITKEPVEFEVYRNGEENGRYVFQTITKTAGKPVLFSMRPEDAGNHKDAIVLYMKSVSDYFYYEAE